MRQELLSITVLIITSVAMINYGCSKDDEPDEPQNSSPTVQNITSIPNTSINNRMTAEGMVAISITATDADNDELYYAWLANGGSFIGETNRETVIWESPLITADDVFLIYASISDGADTIIKSIRVYVGGVTLGDLNGFAYYANTEIPVTGVEITVNNTSVTTRDDGYYEIDRIPVGICNLRAIKEGYDIVFKNIELVSGTNDINTEMTSASYTHNLFGNITSKSNGNGISDCRVEILNPDGTGSQLFSYTSSSGYYQIPTVPEGIINLRITEKCYFETELFLNNSDYQYDAEFLTEVTDPRDGKAYPVVEIGGIAWMAENLNHGDRIDGDDEQTDNQLVEKFCYDDDETNCDVYGGLYQWNEMMQYENTEGAQGICMEGWHIPTDDEWEALVDYVGWWSNAGGKLKEKGTTHWWLPNHGATNISGFTALPGGTKKHNDGFRHLGKQGYFWSSSEFGYTGAWARAMYYDNSSVYGANQINKDPGNSVRCVSD